MDIVERVARAILEVKGGLNYAYEDFCRDAARAALAAMLEAVGEPVEYWYERGDQKVVTLRNCADTFTQDEGWTETPLYSLAVLREIGRHDHPAANPTTRQLTLPPTPQD